MSEGDPEDAEVLPDCPSWLTVAGPEYRLWWRVILTTIQEAMGRPVPDDERGPTEIIREASAFIHSDAFEDLADQVGFSEHYAVGRVRSLVARDGFFPSTRPRKPTKRHKIKARGQEWSMAGIASEAGVSPGTIGTRLANGWEGEDLFKGPANRGPAAQGTTTP